MSILDNKQYHDYYYEFLEFHVQTSQRHLTRHHSPHGLGHVLGAEGDLAFFKKPRLANINQQ